MQLGLQLAAKSIVSGSEKKGKRKTSATSESLSRFFSQRERETSSKVNPISFLFFALLSFPSFSLLPGSLDVSCQELGT